MANVRPIFVGLSQSSLSEVRLHIGRQTLPGASTLTRPGHVLCPDKKHPASARALEPRLPRSWLPWPRRSRPISRSLPSDAAVRLSYVLRGGSVPQVGLYGKVLLVTVLILRYIHHFPHPECHHMTILSLISTPPLLPCLLPSSQPTYGPPDPSFVTASRPGDVAGLHPRLPFNADALIAGSWGSGDGRGTGISCKVRGTWVGPTVGRSSERELVSGIVYNG